MPVGEARPLGIAQHSTTTDPEVEGSSGEASISWPGVENTTSADDSTVAKGFGEAQPPGIAVHGVSTASEFAVSSGESGSARPGAKSTPSAVDAAVAMPVDEVRPGIAKQSATTESDIAVSSGVAGAHPVPMLRQSQCLLVKLSLLVSQSRVPRRSLNSQRVQVKLDLLGPGLVARQHAYYSSRNACRCSSGSWNRKAECHDET